MDPPTTAPWLTFAFFKNAVYPRPLRDDSNPFHKQLIEQEKAHWTPGETVTEIERDRAAFPTLPEPVKLMVNCILHFLFAADAFVASLSTEHIASYFENIVIKGMFAAHGAIEITHARAYGIILEIPYGGPVPLEKTYDFIRKSPAVIQMLAWGKRFNEKELTIIERLVGLLSFELIIFTPLFQPIYAIKDTGTLPAICSTNEMVARDELIHGNNVIVALHYVRDELGMELTREHVVAIFMEAMDCSMGLITEALPVDFPEWKLSKRDALDYTKVISDKALGALGLEQLYRINYVAPDYIKKIGMMQYTSFHSIRPTEYSKDASITELEGVETDDNSIDERTMSAVSLYD